MSKSNKEFKNRKTSVGIMGYKIILACIVIIAILFNSTGLGNITAVKAAVGTKVSVTVDYTTETVNVQPGPGASGKFYMSTDNQKTWDAIPQGVLDISSLISTKKVTVYFKGNKDIDPFILEIPAPDSTLKVLYTVTNGVGSITFAPTAGIQYRVGSNGNWLTATSGMLTAMYEVRGAALSFRLAPTAGVNGSQGTRAGKIVSVRISQKPSAPSVRLDPAKLSITGAKAGTVKYRTLDSTIWLDVPAVTSGALSITKLLNNTELTNTALSGATIEFYTPGAAKKLDSAVKVIVFPDQKAMDDAKVSLVGTTLSIIDADKNKQYEYTVLEQGKSLDYQKANWAPITSKRSVIVPKVSIGANILIRMRSETDKLTGMVSLPSTYVVRTVASISQ